MKSLLFCAVIVLMARNLAVFVSAREIPREFGLRYASDNFRHLQGNGCELCGFPVRQYKKKKTTLLTTIKRKNNKASSRWIPRESEPLCVEIDPTTGNVIVSGTVVLRGSSPSEQVELEVDFTLSGRTTYDNCYCASEYFIKDPLDPDYKKIQKKCDMKTYDQRESAASDLLFCPYCRNNQCQTAQKQGAPDPTYLDWEFFTNATGTIKGKGLKEYREIIRKGTYPDASLDILECTIDITGMPLPQMYCTDYEDPLNGFGYGVNAWDQNCGMSFWFNCAEDIHEGVQRHSADINLDFGPCGTKVPTIPDAPSTNPPIATPNPTTSNPTSSPTLRPSRSPTSSPTDSPTSSPTLRPSRSPSSSPNDSPSSSPTDSPTSSPTLRPSHSPSRSPTDSPSSSPTASPTSSPTSRPSLSPSSSPTDSPTRSPTSRPSSSPTHSPSLNPTESPTCQLTDTALHLCFSLDGSSSIDQKEWKRFQEVVREILGDQDIKNSIQGNGLQDPARGSASTVIWQSKTSGSGGNCAASQENCRIQLHSVIDNYQDAVDSVASRPPGTSYTPLSVGAYECSRQLKEISETREYAGSGTTPQYVNVILTDGWCNVKCGNPCLSVDGCLARNSFFRYGESLGTCNYNPGDNVECVPQPPTGATVATRGSYCNVKNLQTGSPYFNTQSCGTAMEMNDQDKIVAGGGVCDCESFACPSSRCVDIGFWNSVRGEHFPPERTFKDFDNDIPLTTIPVYVRGNTNEPENFLRQLSTSNDYISAANFDDLVLKIKDLIDDIKCADA